MATKTFFLVNAADADGWQDLSESTQGATTIVGGWVVSTGSTNHSEFQQGQERAASTFTGTTVPDGTLDTSLHDAFRTPAALTGNFAAGNWVAHFVVRAVTNGGAQGGRVRFRLIKADANGANAVEITSAQQLASQVTLISTSADSDSTLTFNPGAFSITNQYLFFQIAWERTVAGGMTSADVDFRTGSSASVGTRITTADFAQTTTVTPSAVTLAMSVPAPTLVLGVRTLTPSAVTVAMSILAPTITNVHTLTPASVTMAVSIPAPTVLRGAKVLTPTALSFTTSVGTPTLVKGVRTLLPSAVVVALSIDTPTVTNSGGGPPPHRKLRLVQSALRWR